MDSGHCCDSCYNDDGYNRPKRHWNNKEEQEACQFVGNGMREAASSMHHKSRYLVDDFNNDYYASPCPQPMGKL